MLSTNRHILAFTICIVLILAACKTRQDTVNTLEDINSPVEEIVDGKNTSKNSINWSGVYNGLLTTLENKEIEYSIKFDLDNNYELKSYHPEDKLELINSGKLIWDETENYIVIEDIGWKVKVMEETIQISKLNSRSDLNYDQQTYLYKKKEEQLLNRYWLLSSLGDSLSSLEASTTKSAFLVLTFKERALYYGGCNRCQAAFKSPIQGEIAFIKPGACTKIYCLPENNFDDELNEVLKNTFYYEVIENKLILRSKEKELASFISPI